MTNQQMELGFGAANFQTHQVRRSSRAARAAWWFAQMRRIVESAMDWPASPKARPEQAWLPGARRELKV